MAAYTNIAGTTYTLSPGAGVLVIPDQDGLLPSGPTAVPAPGTSYVFTDMAGIFPAPPAAPAPSDPSDPSDPSAPSTGQLWPRGR